MKKIITLLVTLLGGVLALHAQNIMHPFEILVQKGATEVSFELGGSQTITIDWGDGKVENLVINTDATQKIHHTYSTPLTQNTTITFDATGIERFKNTFTESNIIGVGKVDAPDLISFYHMSYNGSTLAQSTGGVVDLSRCSKLKYICLLDAPGLKLGTHPNLKHIQIESSKIGTPSYATLSNKSINLAPYNELEYVWVIGQKEVKELNTTSLTKITFFRWQDGGLQKAIGMKELPKNNTGLKRLNISGHQLSLNQLPVKNPDVANYDEFLITYNPDGYNIPDANIFKGQVSLQEMITVTDFQGTPHKGSVVWKEKGSNEAIAPEHYTENEGTFKFKESLFDNKESITLEAYFTPAFFTMDELMSDTNIPLKSNAITLNKKDLQTEEANIMLKTNIPIGGEIAINMTGNGITLNGVKEKYQEGDNRNGRYYYTLTSQDITISGNISEFDCNGQQLTVAHISKLPELSYLELHSNSLINFTLRECPLVEELYISKNRLENLELTDLKELNTLDCSSNNLSSLVLTNCKQLSSLWCHHNQLSTIDLCSMASLRELMAYDNHIMALDLSQNPKLKTLNVAENKLSELDLSQNQNIMMVICHTNLIQGDGMTNLAQSLPYRDVSAPGKITVIDSKSKAEKNRCLKADVAIANIKNWTCYDFMGSINNSKEYTGEEETSIKEVTSTKNTLTIFPNPTTDFLYISTTEPVTWSLYNMEGKTLREGESAQVDLSSFAKGSYILHIKSRGMKQAYPIFKK